MNRHPNKPVQNSFTCSQQSIISAMNRSGSEVDPPARDHWAMCLNYSDKESAILSRPVRSGQPGFTWQRGPARVLARNKSLRLFREAPKVAERTKQTAVSHLAVHSFIPPHLISTRHHHRQTPRSSLERRL